MKKLLYLCFGLFLTVAILGLLPVHGEEELYDKVLRLHVVANSDSDEDQSLKLKVRDTVIGEVSAILDGCEDREEAIERLSLPENRKIIEDAARKRVESEGYSYPVSVTLCCERYPTKNYESFCFPSGEYASLKVEIGESEGQNWWCVLFPRLCLNVASEIVSDTADPDPSSDSNKDAFISAGFTPEQYKIVTESEDTQYEIRFKLLEVIKEAMGE